MAVSQNKESCNSCRFFSAESKMGLCKRFPIYANKSENDWCGEWQSTKSAALEMMVEQTIKPIEFEEPKKPRGRPKKC